MEQAKVLSTQTQLSELTHSINGLSVKFEEQYAGGINFIRNSAGLNGISDDWTYTGTVSALQGTDTRNNTVSDSCFQLAASGTLTQIIDSIVPGQSYRLTVKAKKDLILQCISGQPSTVPELRIYSTSLLHFLGQSTPQSCRMCRTVS